MHVYAHRVYPASAHEAIPNPTPNPNPNPNPNQVRMILKAIRSPVDTEWYVLPSLTLALALTLTLTLTPTPTLTLTLTPTRTLALTLALHPTPNQVLSSVEQGCR